MPTVQELEDEVEDLVEANMCLGDDVEQLKAELAESKDCVLDNNEVGEALARFMALLDGSRGRPDPRALENLYEELRRAGYSYERCEEPWGSATDMFLRAQRVRYQLVRNKIPRMGFHEDYPVRP